VLASAAVASDASDPGWKAEDVNIAQCFAAMDHDPALASVNSKYARRDPTAAQLADTHVATDEETNRLKSRIAKTAPCREMRIKAVSRHYPSLMPSYRILYFQADQIFEYLMNKWITYGEANRLSQLSQQQFKDREAAYFRAATEQERPTLSKSWSDAFIRVRVKAPPDGVAATCAWVDLALSCQ